MSIEKPQYASQVPFVPVNWEDRDAITGRILEILEAVLPEGKQLTATKNLVKECTKQYWITLFNDQYDELSRSDDDAHLIASYYREPYYTALWETAVAKGANREAGSTEKII